MEHCSGACTRVVPCTAVSSGMLQRGGVSAADLGLAQFRICIHDRDECFDRGEMHFSCERSYFGFGLIHGEFHKWYAPAPPW